MITVECKNLSIILLSRLSLYADELLEIVVEYFRVIEQLLIPFPAFVSTVVEIGAHNPLIELQKSPLNWVHTRHFVNYDVLT